MSNNLFSIILYLWDITRLVANRLYEIKLIDSYTEEVDILDLKGYKAEVAVTLSEC